MENLHNSFNKGEKGSRMEHSPLYTIGEAAGLLKSKQLSPVQLFHYCMNRINRFDEHMNTFITLMEDEALKQAEQAEREIMSGNYKGPLHGIPLSLKDIIAYAGFPMTNGSRVAPEFVPSVHATVSHKIIDAGAVVMGKAHLFEYAFRAPHPHYGWTKNPWDSERITGGSSSGSGAAVQAGFVLGSIGSDTGGSIRMPASLCGVVGLKPTYGRVSRYGVTPLSVTLDHVGTVTRTCEDAAILLQAIAGYDYKDEVSHNELCWNRSSFQKLESLKGKKLGIPMGYFYEDLEPDVEAAVSRALTLMEDMGAELVPVEWEKTQQARAANLLVLRSEAYAYHCQALAEQGEGYGPQLRLALEAGRNDSAEAYRQAMKLRAEMKESIHSLFNQVDVLITPTMPIVAPQIECYANDEPFSFPNFTSIANLLGLPAVSIPVGFSTNRLPIGLQIIGPAFHEGEILSIGHFYEQIALWYKELPGENHWTA
jgi:aspartyl-tRNA(Asn)/glutamyl-tRNA(Gln) amidotransferase subunit A